MTSSVPISSEPLSGRRNTATASCSDGTRAGSSGMPSRHSKTGTPIRIATIPTRLADARTTARAVAPVVD